MALFLNLYLFIFGIIGCVKEYRREGISIIRYYTFDSNVLGTIAGGLIFVLCPMERGYKDGLLKGNLKYQHLLCPLIAIVSCIFFDPEIGNIPVALIMAWIPTVIYAVVILTSGRYVGIEEQEDDGEPFEQKMNGLTSELSDMFAKSHELEDEIRGLMRRFL